MTGPTNKSKERKHQIMQAAQELFNQKGFPETSIDDIMKKIGAAKGAFYYYFQTKDQILEALVEQHVAEIVAAALKIAETADLDALQKLQFLLQEEFKISLTHINPENHLHNIRNVDMHQLILVRLTREFTPIISRIIEQGITEGIFKINYPLEAAEIVIAGIFFITDLGIFAWDQAQYVKKLKAAAEVIEKILEVKTGSFQFLASMQQELPNLIRGEK